MITEKDTIKSESVFNDERTHRFLLKRIWDKNKPLVTVVMLNPSLSDNIINDLTTNLCVNNVARLESYGGVQIVNLYSLLTSKLSFRWSSDEEINDPQNDEYIKQAVEDCEIAVLAWGRASATNDRIAERAVAVINMLAKHKDKFVTISDSEGRTGIHPLTPAARACWHLEKVNFDNPDWLKPQTTENAPTEAKSRKHKEKEDSANANEADD